MLPGFRTGRVKMKGIKEKYRGTRAEESSGSTERHVTDVQHGE